MEIQLIRRAFAAEPRYLVALGVVMALLHLPAHAFDATFTVTNLNDSGPGSLRQAVLDANITHDNVQSNLIVFQSGLSGTINLTSGEITASVGSSNGFALIIQYLTIEGPGAKVLTISGSNISRIFRIDGFGDGGGHAEINNLTLRDGYASYGGAIIVDNSSLVVNNCKIFNNVAYRIPGADYTNGAGGGIYNGLSGKLTVIDSAITDNSAGNAGGGIGNNGTLTITNSTLSSNSAFVQGGGIDNQGAVSIINSTLSGNSAPGNPYTVGVAGGGIWNAGTLTVGNSILAGNSIPTGGIGKEVYIATGGTFTSRGHNLFGENGSSGLVNANPIASDLILPGLISTALGPLTDNGGPTPTQLPVPGSLALNHGDNARIPSGSATDQRGSGFPRIVNNVVDIGAVEVQPPGSLLAGLTSTGQIYTTTIARYYAEDGQLVNADAMGSLPHANAWGNIPGQLARLRVGDFNGDGEGDLVGLAGNGAIWYTTNRGVWTQVPGGLSQIGAGDFNGDGQDDLVGLGDNGSVWYTTDLSVWAQVPGQLAQIQVGDLNGDGKADLAGVAGNGTVWYTTDLSVWAQVPGQLAQIQVGDLNGDGKADLAGVASNSSVWYTTDLSVWAQVPGQLAQLQVGDLDGDGKGDLAGVAGNSSVWYTTDLSVWAQLPGALSQLTTSDLNGDGKGDLAGLANNGTIWYTTDLSVWTNIPGQLAQLAGR